MLVAKMDKKRIYIIIGIIIAIAIVGIAMAILSNNEYSVDGKVIATDESFLLLKLEDNNDIGYEYALIPRVFGESVGDNMHVTFKETILVTAEESSKYYNYANGKDIIVIIPITVGKK